VIKKREEMEGKDGRRMERRSKTISIRNIITILFGMQKDKQKRKREKRSR
jgi:hypothetical protein